MKFSDQVSNQVSGQVSGQVSNILDATVGKLELQTEFLSVHLFAAILPLYFE